MGKPKTRRRKFNSGRGKNSHVYKLKKIKLLQKVDRHVSKSMVFPGKCVPYMIKTARPAPGRGVRFVVRRLRINSHHFRIMKSPEKATKVTFVKKTSPPLDGYRIVNMERLSEFISLVIVHGMKCLKSAAVTLKGDPPITVSEEKRDGFSSTLKVTCNSCGEILHLETSSSHPTNNRQDINMRAVWGCMATGSGLSSLNELTATMGIPGMRPEQFRAIETSIGDAWREVLLKDMKEAGEEEKRLAIARNDYHQGVPAITVVCDGGWSKRTHKHTYNALGGVAVIFGVATGKLLHIGVRNKHCYVCSVAESRNAQPKAHRCFRNWTESSQAMEAHIIVDGFLEAERVHGVRYMRFIGDGDSSVYARIMEEVPIWGREVTKLECANHACKCLRSNLERLVEEKPYFKGKGRLTKNNIIRLTKGVRCAIKMRSAESNRQEAVKKLTHDISNAAHHVFGNHQNCSDFCKKRDTTPPPSRSASPIPDNTESTKDHVTDIVDGLQSSWDDVMNEDGLEESRYAYSSNSKDASVDHVDPEILREVTFLLNRLANKSDRLLGNFTTNLAESWMFIRCKFDGGKIINRCNRGSWHSRCYGGGLRKNFGPAWSPLVWHQVTGIAPSTPFTSHYRFRALHLRNSRKSKAQPEVKQRAYKRKKQSQNQSRSKKARKEYGEDSLDGTPDISEDQLKAACDTYLKENINISNVEANDIKRKTVGQSFSSTWIAERKKRLTSSMFGEVISRNPTNKVSPLVKRILYSSFAGNSYTRRGLREEGVTIKEYIRLKEESTNQTVTVEQSGLVICNSTKCLAASPDGYVNVGSNDRGLIEIKNLLQNNQLSLKQAAEKGSFCLENVCEKLRLKHTHKYYYQCQGQLNICDLPWLDFVVRRTNPYEIHIERIHADKQLWQNEMLPKLTSFYMKCLLPELASPRIKSNTGLREPEKPWFVPVHAALTSVSQTRQRKPQRQRKKTTVERQSTHNANDADSKERRSSRRKKSKFVGRRILHKWCTDEENDKYDWFEGTVLECSKGMDGCIGAEYEVKYVSEKETFIVDHLQEDLESGSLKFIDV